jgi:hypothetical protein
LVPKDLKVLGLGWVLGLDRVLGQVPAAGRRAGE